MSLLDSLPPLPAVISPAVEAKAEAPLDDKRFIIILSRDMSEEDKAIFRQHGKVLEWGPQFLNVPFSSLEFDYLLIDARTKQARLTLGRQDLKQYHKVAYVFWVQKGVDDMLAQLDTIDISSIPQHAINRADFESMLLNEKLVAPSVGKSLFKLLKACVGGA
jgi:hypothetical protein